MKIVPGPMPLPPQLYEIMNVAIATMCLIVTSYCIYFALCEYRDMRKGLSLSPLEALREVFKWRLAIGTTVAFFGEGLRTTWIAIGLLLQARGYDATWMGDIPFVAVPVLGSILLILGGACIARSIIPREWGRWAYLVTVVAVAIAVTVMQFFR